MLSQDSTSTLCCILKVMMLSPHLVCRRLSKDLWTAASPVFFLLDGYWIFFYMMVIIWYSFQYMGRQAESRAHCKENDWVLILCYIISVMLRRDTTLFFLLFLIAIILIHPTLCTQPSACIRYSIIPPPTIRRAEISCSETWTSSWSELITSPCLRT
mgnify:CR=1 FL=1